MNLFKMSHLIVLIVFTLCSNHVFADELSGEICYEHLDCLSLEPPWHTVLRPMPIPQPPYQIDTRFYMYTRDRPTHGDVVEVNVTTLDVVRPTFFITHGFTHSANETWLHQMKDALLRRFDSNVILVDWGKGASNMNYLLVASNIRVVAAEVIRLSRYLIAELDADVRDWHFIGHSLGAHMFSYVAKALPGVGRITALDPAQPAFEGYSQEVRLDASDALFVDVIHTNARPFIPLIGLGMMGAYGHVDFYMNGGLDQPGCVIPSPKLINFQALNNLSVEELMNYVSCPHERAYAYFTDSIEHPNCTYWGRRIEDVIFGRSCWSSSCSPLGLESINYPARGSFYVTTNSLDPFCSQIKSADVRMNRFRNVKNRHFVV